MNVNPLKVNIELKSDDINGKWYAKKDVSKDKETTVTFFQREGKRTFLQKIKDFRNGVRYGTELASKYSKELGLSEEVFSNPKNKSEKPTISNDTLNTKFREAQEKLGKNEIFKESDSLVSHNDISIYINKAKINNAEDHKNSTVHYFFRNFYKHETSLDNWEKHISLALDVRANPSFQADIKKIDEAIDFFSKVKDLTLPYDHYKTEEYNENRNKIFQDKVNHLLSSLNTALKKINNDST
jgi:hypothetical protein